MTIITHLICNSIFNYKHLLQCHATHNFAVYGELHLQLNLNVTIIVSSLLLFVVTLIRLEWGSVQINPASTSFTLFKAFSLRKHRPNSSLDSRAHDIHSNGGWRYLSQLRQNCNIPCLGMSCVMSTCVRRHVTHMLAGFESMAIPHWQHNLRKRKQGGAFNDHARVVHIKPAHCSRQDRP